MYDLLTWNEIFQWIKNSFLWTKFPVTQMGLSNMASKNYSIIQLYPFTRENNKIDVIPTKQVFNNSLIIKPLEKKKWAILISDCHFSLGSENFK